MKRDITFELDMFYHLYNRGVNRGLIYFDDENYLFFIRNIKRYLLPVMDIVAYCLMPTHYHLLIFVTEGCDYTFSPNDSVDTKRKISPATQAIQKFSISYTKAINKRYDRVGPLFQGPYRAKNISTISHSKRIIPYIHENPVHAGLVNTATDWIYSSSKVYEGMEEPGFLTPLI